MPSDATTEIKARLDIVEVIGGYVRLQRGGHEFKGLCPFHAEKTPSLSVSQEKQVFLCRGCGVGGDVFEFVERIERVDFRQALEMLAERAGVDLEPGDRGSSRAASRRRKRALELHARAQAYYTHVLWRTAAGEPGRQLLQERAVSDSVAQRFGIGFAPGGGAGGDALVRYLLSRASATVEEIVDAGLAQPHGAGHARDRFRHRLVFPIRDERGATIGFGGRAMGDAMPKYLNTPETALYRKSAVIFGLDLARQAIAREQRAVVVEGYFDVVSAHAAGVAPVVASSGTALTRDQVRILGRHAPLIVLCFDSDEAGLAAASRAVDVIASEGLAARICLLPDGVKDPDELVRRDRDAFLAMVDAAAPEWQVLLDRALAGAEGGSVDARRTAAERTLGVLARIPEASTRELFLQQAARRLEVGAQSLAADLAKLLREGPRRPVRITVAPPPAAPARADEPDPAAGIAMPESEMYVAGIVLHRPAAARAFIEDLGLDLAEVTHPTVRQILTVALQAGGAAEGFPLRALSGHDQRRAVALMMRNLPELSPDAEPAHLERAMRDCVRRVREGTVRRSLKTIEQELHRAKEEGREEEVQRLAARVTELAAEAHALRAPVGAR